MLAAAREGLGLAVLPWYVARDSVAEGRLQPVMIDHALPAQEVHAVFPSPRLVPQKVTSFIAFVQQALAGEGWLRAPDGGGRVRPAPAARAPAHARADAAVSASARRPRTSGAPARAPRR